MTEYKKTKKKVKTQEDLSLVKGLIYNIQRYSLHDGPGIRTIVFLKGCSLYCPWCANPESQSTKIELMGDEVVGKEVSVGEVIKVVERDKPFYDRSGGGMTLSGGEPLQQPTFAEALVKEAKKRDINIAIETSGFQKWNLLWKVVKDIDVVLLDIKIMDPAKHKDIIGVDNHTILYNAKKMVDTGKEVIVRVPVIPGYTDSLENLNGIAGFCRDIGVNEIHFLPYHRLGVNKYGQLGRAYKLHGIKPILREDLEAMSMKISEQFQVKITVH